MYVGVSQRLSGRSVASACPETAPLRSSDTLILDALTFLRSLLHICVLYSQRELAVAPESLFGRGW